MIATVILLAIFMGLAIIGIGESAKVAVIIFITHLISLLLLVVICSWFLLNHGLEVFNTNWHLPIKSGGLVTALFLGFSAAMLGISGLKVLPILLKNSSLVFSLKHLEICGR